MYSTSVSVYEMGVPVSVYEMGVPVSVYEMGVPVFEGCLVCIVSEVL